LAPLKQKEVAKSPKPAKGGLADWVYRQLEERIVTLQLRPGALLSEAELGQQVGVSRTPVAAALQRLAREGLVNILPQRGVVVTEISLTDQLRVLELRCEFSRFLARMGARRAKLDQRARMRRLAEGFEAAAERGDQGALLQVDKEFHELFSGCAQNSFASSLMDPLDSLARRFWFAHTTGSDDPEQSAKLHAEIARAIADGDEEGAAAASDALSGYLESFARQTLDT